MATGFRVGTTDFDDLFDPDIIGDGPAAAGLKVGTTPLKYAALAYGTKRANVGVIHGGADVSNLWAAKGTAGYIDPGPLTGLNAYQYPSGSPTAGASIAVELLRNGDWRVVAGGTGGLAPPPAVTGRWFAGAGTTNPGDGYEARVVLVSSNGQAPSVMSNWTRLDVTRAAFSVAVSNGGNAGLTVEASGSFRIEFRPYGSTSPVFQKELSTYRATVDPGA